jgi:hypothetical protein
MRSLHIAALVVAGLAASGAPVLKVLRVAPTDDADPTSVVMVTFDRPVARSLDRSVDPQSIFTIAPGVKGKVAGLPYYRKGHTPPRTLRAATPGVPG